MQNMNKLSLTDIKNMLKDGAPDLNSEVGALRKDFSEMSNNLPKPDGVRIEQTSFNGVTGLLVSGDWADESGIIMYLHGGAYAFGSASDYASLVSVIAKSCRKKAFVPDYRLAPENPYPAALHDAASAYKGIIDSGFSPKNTYIMGDSAGGGLTIATLLYLKEKGIELPEAAVVLSPWANLQLSGSSVKGKAEADFILNESGLRRFAMMYSPGTQTDNQYISPVYGDMEGLPRLLIQVGSSEILLSDSLQLAEKAANSDVAVSLQVWPELFHVWQMFSGMLDESDQAIEAIGSFIDKSNN